ncbi:MAG TPA: anhydro-N-acetylmuramic acid kinase [Chryseolinea sp.]
MDSRNNFKAIGLMSGTSLDGLDIAYAHFAKNKGQWSFSLKKSTTIRYSSAWVQKLSTAQHLTGEQLLELDSAYGKFLGKVCSDFIRRNRLKVDFIASHGHTIFHQPKKRFTYQLGNGSAIHAACGVPVVYDFRSLDVMQGGEGAPLVPVGDKFLFSDYDVCLNLGGIANLSREVGGKRVAFDICFANMGLNYLASKIEKEFDKNGALSSEGEIDMAMLKKLDAVYSSLRKSRPSLGREMFEARIKPVLDDPGVDLKDKLRTMTLSSAKEIALAITSEKKRCNVLCTGGGAFNSFFISQLLDQCGDNITLIIPDSDVIKFKEAIVFAFLGVLRVRGETNCLKSVTGAISDSCSGSMIGF